MKIRLDEALRIDRKIRAGYMTAFILLFLCYLLTFYATIQVIKQSKSVNHTNAVVLNVQNVVFVIKDAESSFRGYLIMKDDIFLVPYKTSAKKLDSLFNVLNSLAKDNLKQQQNVNALRALMNQRYEIWQNAIKSFATHNNTVTDSLQKTGYKGKSLMNSISAVIADMQNTELGLMKTRQQNLAASSNAIQIITITSLIIAVILAFYSMKTFNKENKAKKEADTKAVLYRKQIEERIEELDKVNKELVNLKSIEKFAATGRIARTIAHEVRNPLTNISLAAEQLKGEMSENDEVTILLEMINRNTSRINQLISDLLNSTRFAQLEFKKVSINQLLDETLEFAKDRLDLNGIKVEKNYSTDICDVFVDSEKIKIAFLNIIVNAIEAMEAGKGVLKIKTEKRKNKCVITISDNGTGISEESLYRLFEPYFTSKLKGTGLGLTNTQNIILNHKGSITAESVLGKGSSFITTLDFA